MARQEAVAEQDGVGLELGLATGAAQRCAQRATLRPRDRAEDAAVEKRDAPPRKRGQVAHALHRQGRIRCGHRHRRARALPGMRGGLHDADHLRAALREFAGDLHVERAIPRDQNPTTREHSMAAPERLRRACGHHAGQRPAGDDMRPLIGASGHDHGARGDQPRARPVEDGESVQVEGAPELRPAQDPRAGSLRRHGERAAFRLLRVEHWRIEARRRLLVVLPAER